MKDINTRRQMEPSNHPKVSVITVSFNAVKDIEKTMLSVLNQTYDNIEYIVIDGGSTDGTVDIIKKYEDRLAYWVSESDGGIYFGMNKGIRAATGEWINFMNAGDVFYDNDVVNKIFSKDYADKKVIYGDIYMEKGRTLNYNKAESLYILERRMPFCHQAVFLRSFNKNEIYFKGDKYKIAADYEVFNRIYYTYGASAFEYVHMTVAIFDGNGVSKTRPLDTSMETLKISGLHKRDCYWFKKMLKIVIKKTLVRK